MSLDLSRLSQLETILGESAAEIAAGLRDSMAATIARIESGVGAGELADAARAAHSCRNDALMVGATQLLRVLDTLEQACRDGLPDAARAGLASLREIWPATLEQLESAARFT